MDFNWQGKTEVFGGKPATLPTTNPTWTTIGLNSALRGVNAASKGLTYVTAFMSYVISGT
jgi:hypothetical protein